MIEPPSYAVEFSVRAANASPCAKSKRGVAIFDPELRGIVGGGHNQLPRNLSCDGSAECRRDCRRICVHAEQYAIRNMWEQRESAARFGGRGEWSRFDVLHLVHVKTVDSILVAGGTPSCDECSKLILDVGLGYVWLYEAAVNRCLACRRFEDSSAVPGERYKRCPECGADLTPIDMWRRYTALEFHRATLHNLGLHGG